MIKVVKLITGEDLISSVNDDNISNLILNPYYVLEDPMIFHVDYRNNSSLVMQHYLPVQLIKENKIIIKEKDVLAIIEADEEFIEYYLHTIEKIKRLLKVKEDVSNMTDEEISHLINEFEIEINESGTLH